KLQPKPGKTTPARVSCRASLGSASVGRKNLFVALSFPRSRSNLGTVGMFIIRESGVDQKRGTSGYEECNARLAPTSHRLSRNWRRKLCIHAWDNGPLCRL